ncbi:hypothetical protein [Brevibacillus daliensis]|uniref:hypothetical protein n=1 Tax=Brevibacillus daliensis TaxID=2892995 RepID=UPI001E4A654B|nr:hypothetical protein [Brevibacillus daliensis]
MLRKSLIAIALVVVSLFSVTGAFANEVQSSNTQAAADKYWAVITKKFSSNPPDTITYDDGKGYIGTLTRGTGNCFPSYCEWTYSGWVYYQY